MSATAIGGARIPRLNVYAEDFSLLVRIRRLRIVRGLIHLLH